jgi:hypothetical protein
VPVPAGAGDGQAEDREQVQQAECDPDGRRGVPGGGRDAEAEQGDQGEDEPVGGALVGADRVAAVDVDAVAEAVDDEPGAVGDGDAAAGL